jgi:hypothetical protein
MFFKKGKIGGWPSLHFRLRPASMRRAGAASRLTERRLRIAGS